MSKGREAVEEKNTRADLRAEALVGPEDAEVVHRDAARRGHGRHARAVVEALGRRDPGLVPARGGSLRWF